MSNVRYAKAIIIDLEHDQLRLTLEEAAALVRCRDTAGEEYVDDTSMGAECTGVGVCVGWNHPALVPDDVVEQVRAELAKEPS